MEGFSDGVYGFAATLLVLDLALRPPGTPLQQVLHGWPGYLAYLVSFLTIGVSWLLHTALTDQLTGTDQLFLRLNLLLLLVVVFLPFPTGLIADHLHNTSGERVYVTMYGLTVLAISLLGRALDAYARHEHLYSPATEGEELHRDRRKFSARRHRVCHRDPHRAPAAGRGGGAVRRYRGVPGGAVPGSRTSAVPAAHPPMNAAPAPTTPAGTGTAQCLR
jgi:uncharacterized membrane protein